MSARLRNIGRTVNTDYFLVTDDVMVVMPRRGTQDDGQSARANVCFQLDYARALGRKIGVVVVLTNLLSQDAAARKVYAEEMDPELVFGAALVVSNPLSRAIGSFFLGFTKPKFPTRLFETVDAAVAWLEGCRSEAA